MAQPIVDADALRRFLTEARAIVGADHVFDTAEDRDAYADQFAFDLRTHYPSGAIAPASTEEIQALLMAAGALGVPLWPISRGKNFGYGGSAPVMSGTVILDLSRMRRILEVNVELGYCLVEPGVSFFDLYDHLKAMGHPLWMSVPGNAWGSVAGNALERGAGAQPYGDHGAQICGLEVILPTGELLRTGTGAMAGSKTWTVTRNSYGPNWEQMFCQSNFGVVTKLGLWLMPAPEATMTINLALPEPDDIERGVAMLQGLRLRGLIDHDAAWVSYVGIASYASPRSRWFEGKGLLPDEIGARIRKDLGVGWWNAQVNLYGHEDVIAAKSRVIREAFKAHVEPVPEAQIWRRGDPFENSKAGIPCTRDMVMINWLGTRGGHIGFSPVLPANPKQVAQQFARTVKRFREHGIDYYGAFAVGGRAVVNINEILYDRDDMQMASSVDLLIRDLIADAARAGYAEYRAHIDYMESVAATFDFNAGAIGKLNSRLKEMIDPQGILAPGKQGIWPSRFSG